MGGSSRADPPSGRWAQGGAIHTDSGTELVLGDIRDRPGAELRGPRPARRACARRQRHRADGAPGPLPLPSRTGGRPPGPRPTAMTRLSVGRSSPPSARGAAARPDPQGEPQACRRQVLLKPPGDSGGDHSGAVAVTVRCGGGSAPCGGEAPSNRTGAAQASARIPHRRGSGVEPCRAPERRASVADPRATGTDHESLAVGVFPRWPLFSPSQGGFFHRPGGIGAAGAGSGAAMRGKPSLPLTAQPDGSCGEARRDPAGDNRRHHCIRAVCPAGTAAAVAPLTPRGAHGVMA